MSLFYLALMLSTLVGSLAIKLLSNLPWKKWLLICSLGTGLGAGLASCLYFALVATAPGQVIPLWFSVVSVLLTTLLVTAYKQKRSLDPTETTTHQDITYEDKRLLRWLMIAFVGLLVVALSSFAVQVWLHPHSDWDALMIWNLRARLLERPPVDIAQIFNAPIPWSHPDYPLLLPSLVALGLKLSAENQLAPAAVALLYTFSTAFLLLSALTICRSKLHGLSAAIILLTTPFWTHCGTMMYADVPLGYYLLATATCCALYDRKRHWGYLLLSGTFSALSAWTKNEGLLFVICILIATAMARRKFAVSPKALIYCLVGALPVLILLVWFKLNLAPANDLINAQSLSEISARLADLGRWLLVGITFIVNAFTFGDWIISPVPFFILCWVLNGSKLDDISSKRAVYTVGLMAGGYALIYLLTPFEVRQHMSTSANRLFLQLWPLLIFGLINASKISIATTVHETK